MKSLTTKEGINHLQFQAFPSSTEDEKDFLFCLVQFQVSLT